MQSIASTSGVSAAAYGHQLATSWSLNSQRNQTSLYSTVISNHLSQFTRFMYAQTIMYKNDTGGLLGSGGVQFNPNLVNLGTIGLDSIEFMNSSPMPMVGTLTSGLVLTGATTTQVVNASSIAANSNMNSGTSGVSTSASSSIQYGHSKQPSTSSITSGSSSSGVSSSQQSKALVKAGPFGSGFSLFGFIRKGSAKEDAAFNEQAQIQKQQQQMQQQQQQMAQEQQQQKLKQQKTDLKTIGQYIKSFESIVIKSLRQYTLTTSVNLQARILELLTTLIFLKVCQIYYNYIYFLIYNIPINTCSND